MLVVVVASAFNIHGQAANKREDRICSVIFCMHIHISIGEALLLASSFAEMQENAIQYYLLATVGG